MIGNGSVRGELMCDPELDSASSYSWPEQVPSAGKLAGTALPARIAGTT